MNFSENTRKQDRIDFIFGNDIVDLSDADSSFPEAAFLKRVFTAGEQKLIHSSEERTLVWSLWAAKEASYKAFSSIHKIPFQWKSFEVLPSLKEVHYKGGRLSLSLQTEKDFIHAVCAGKVNCGRSFPDSRPLFAGAVSFDPSLETESSAVRRAALDALSERLNAEKKDFREVAYGPGDAPAFLLNEKELIRMSFSHHGRHAAFACMPLPVSRSL